jgi:hypothetical protein
MMIAALATQALALPLALQQPPQALALLPQPQQQQELAVQLDDDEDDENEDECHGEPASARQIAAAKAASKNKTDRNKTKIQHAIQMASGCSSSSTIATKTFGYGLPCSEKYNEKTQETTSAGVTITVNKTNQKQTQILKGLVSHVQSVRQQLQCYMNDTDYMVHSEIEDEASMWCRRTLTKSELAAAKAEEQRKKQAGKKTSSSDRKVTKKTRTPCLNIVQHAVLKRNSSGGTCSFQIHSPTIGMAKGNWSTMVNAIEKWSLRCCSKVGKHLAGEASDLQETIDNIFYIGKCKTQDDAGQNACILAAEQQALKREREPGVRIRTLMSNKCLSHQSCLCNRSIYEQVEDDHPSFLARLSHLMQNNRTLTGILEKCDLHIENVFEYHAIETLPEEVPEWNSYARFVLRPALSAHQLTQEQVDHIVTFDNSDWKQPEMIHYCKVGVCPHGCKNRDDALQKAKMCVRTSLGMGMETAEVYRWKGVENANSYYQRGRGQHEVLARGLRLQWDRKACDLAISAVEGLGAVDAEALTFSVMNSAKAGHVLREIDKDKDNTTSFRLSLLTWPIQQFLNATFEADKFACTFSGMRSFDPDSNKTAKARASLFKANIAFFNGSRGEKVLTGYMSMLQDLNSQAWERWQGDGDEGKKLAYAKQLLLPMVDAWRRLVVVFKNNDSFEVLGATECDGCELYDPESLQILASKLKTKLAACSECVCQDFTIEMLQLVDDRPELVHTASVDTVLMLRVGSAVVERAHISGQELKPLKSRGVALDAQALAMTTYRKSAMAEGAWLLKRVQEEVRGELNISAEAMSRHSKSLRLGNKIGNTSASAKSKSKKLRTIGGQQRVGLLRKVDGHKKFRRSHWNSLARVGTKEFIEEERRVGRLWNGLDDATKALWDLEGKAENDRLLSLPKTATMKEIDDAVIGGMSHGREMALRRETVLGALKAIDSHKAWSNGLGLCSASSALKSEYITDDTAPACRAFVKTAFGYDESVVMNPKCSMKPQLPCALRNWGLCSKDVLRSAAATGTANLYRLMQQNDLCRGKFPIIAKLKLMDVCSQVAITDTIGKGETILLVHLNFDSILNAWMLELAAPGPGGKQQPHCAFSQQAIRQLLQDAAVKHKVNASSFSSFDVEFFSNPVPVSCDGTLALRKSPDQEAISHTVPLNVMLAKAKLSKEEAEAGASGPRLPFGLMALSADSGLEVVSCLLFCVLRQGKRGFRTPEGLQGQMPPPTPHLKKTNETNEKKRNNLNKTNETNKGKRETKTNATTAGR